MAKTDYFISPAWPFGLHYHDRKERMKVYVIMGNDYPDAVFRRKDEAEAYVELKKKQDEEQQRQGHGRIYWRVYDFDLQE
jgi:hypothetical protein